jgi:hypothetical protein
MAASQWAGLSKCAMWATSGTSTIVPADSAARSRRAVPIGKLISFAPCRISTGRPKSRNAAAAGHPRTPSRRNRAASGGHPPCAVVPRL